LRDSCRAWAVGMAIDVWCLENLSCILVLRLV